MGDRGLTVSMETNPARTSPAAVCPPAPPAAWNFWLFPPTPGPREGHHGWPQGNFLQLCGSPRTSGKSLALWAASSQMDGQSLGQMNNLRDTGGWAKCPHCREGMSHLGLPLGTSLYKIHIISRETLNQERPMMTLLTPTMGSKPREGK